jgi:hypothetical protein
VKAPHRAGAAHDHLLDCLLAAMPVTGGWLLWWLWSTFRNPSSLLQQRLWFPLALSATYRDDHRFRRRLPMVLFRCFRRELKQGGRVIFTDYRSQ